MDPMYRRSNTNGARLGFVLKSSQGDIIAQAIHCEFKASTENEAEYEALIVALNVVAELKVKGIEVSCNSLLIVNQFNGSYAAKDQKIAKYLDIVKDADSNFDEFTIKQIHREHNV